MPTNIYLGVTAMSVENRSDLSDKIEEAFGKKVRSTGGGTGFGPDAESDMDFLTDLTAPKEVMELAAGMWAAVERLTGGKIKVHRISVFPGKG